MTSRTAALVLIAGISLLAASIPRSHPPHPARRVHVTERPWLTRDLQDRLIGPGGTLGPLFAGVTLGGTPPLPEVQAEIAQFAKAHDVAIWLEIIDDTVVAVRVAITFGGCCGYEAADVLAMRLSRPKREMCIDCPGEWVDDWAYTPEPGIHLRARVRVNQVALRWEAELAPAELLEQADSVFGARVDRLARTLGDRFVETAAHVYRLELPYDPELPQAPYSGIHVEAHAGVVSELGFEIDAPDITDVLRAHWGRPHVAPAADMDGGDVELTWQRRDRKISALVTASNAVITIDGPDDNAVLNRRLLAIREAEAADQTQWFHTTQWFQTSPF